MAIVVPSSHGAQNIGGVKANVAKTPYQTLRAPDTSSAGRQLAQFGAAIGGLNLAMHERRDEINTLAAEKVLNERLMQYNDPDGFRALQGVNADGITLSIQDDWAKFSGEVLKEYRSKLSGKSLRALDKHIESVGMRVHGATATHELNELNTAVLAGMDASLNLLKDATANGVTRSEALAYEEMDVAKSGKDNFDVEFTNAVLKTKTIVAQIAHKTGATPETAAALLLDKTSALVASRVNFMATGKNPNPGAAVNFLNLSHDQGLISEGSYNQLIEVLRPMAEKVEINARAVSAVQQDLARLDLAESHRRAASERAAEMANIVATQGNMPIATGFLPQFNSSFTAFTAAAGAAGLRVGITSGFRTASEQARIIGDNMSKYTNPQTGVRFTAEEIARWRKESGGSDAAAIEAGQKWGAIFQGAVGIETGYKFRNRVGMPGMSRHQHGAAADISVNGKRVSDLSADQKKKLIAIAEANGMHFPISGEDWHIEIKGADGGRYNGGAPLPQSGHDALIEGVRNARTPEEIRLSVGALAQFNGINGEINTSRANMQNNTALAASDTISQNAEAIVTGELQLEQLVTLDDIEKMGAKNHSDIVAYFESVRKGTLVSTDMSEGSVYDQVWDQLQSNGDPRTVQANVANLLNSAEGKTTVSPVDVEAIQRASSAYGAYTVPSIPEQNAAIKSALQASGQFLDVTDVAERDRMIAQIRRDLGPKLIALSTSTGGEKPDMSSEDVSRLIDEAAARVTTDRSDKGELTADYAARILDENGDNHEAAFQSMKGDVALLGMEEGAKGVKIKTSDLDALWSSLKMDGIATIPNLLEVMYDLTELEEDPSSSALIGTKLNLFQFLNASDGAGEAAGWEFYSDADAAGEAGKDLAFKEFTESVLEGGEYSSVAHMTDEELLAFTQHARSITADIPAELKKAVSDRQRFGRSSRPASPPSPMTKPAEGTK